MRWCSLHYTNTLIWIFIVVTHWNNSPLVDMSLNSDTLSRFRSYQSLHLFLNAANTNFILTQSGVEPIIYRTLDEYANHYSPMFVALHWARCTTVCQRLTTGRWFSPGPPFSSTYKTDSQDITEILLKVALNTIKQTNKQKTQSFN
jgi:hypothetical protein